MRIEQTEVMRSINEDVGYFYTSVAFRCMPEPLYIKSIVAPECIGNEKIIKSIKGSAYIDIMTTLSRMREEISDFLISEKDPEY